MKLKDITFKKVKDAIINIELKTVVIILLLITLIVTLYLIALGLRYKHIGDEYFFDTWTQKQIDTEYTPHRRR